MRTLDEIIPVGMDKQAFLTKCRTDFKYFCEHVIQQDTDHSKPLIIKPFHMEWFNYFYNKERSAIMAPRGHGKTQVLGVAFPIWIALFNQYQEFLIISSTLDNAKKLLERIKVTLMDNELLQELIPRKFDLSWSKSEINTITRCKIYCKPHTNSVRGDHVNWALCDEASIYNDKDIFYSAVSPTVNVKKGHLMLIGTPKSEIDLLSEMFEKKGYSSKKYSAIMDGKLLFEEKFSKEKLVEIKNELGPITFAREYMCQIQTDETSYFPMHELVKGFDPEANFEPVASEKGEYIIGADLATSEKGDYTVFTVIKRNGGKNQIVHIDRNKGLSPRTQEERLADLTLIYKPLKIIIDASQIAPSVIEGLRNRGIYVEPFSFTARSKRELYMNLRSIVYNEKLIIPRYEHNPTIKYLTDTLARELNGLFETDSRTGAHRIIKSTTKHDDMADSLALACYSQMATKISSTMVVSAKKLAQTNKMKLIGESINDERSVTGIPRRFHINTK